MLVSVIIPVLNEADSIQRCVAAAHDNALPDQVEIIVVDGGSTDGTRERVPADATLLRSPRGRAMQMNYGAAQARGDILVFCHADSILPHGWREAVVAKLTDPQISGGTFQTLILPARGVLHWRNRWRFAANWKIMFGDQVQFMRRETFEAIGGFPEIPLMEDVEMSRALHKRGHLVRMPVDLRVETSSRRFLAQGVLRQILLNAVNMVRYLYLGATPDEIAASYRSSREAASSRIKRRLIVYARWPHPGRAKTRLAKGIGPEAAAGVYARLLHSFVGDMVHSGVDAEIELSIADAADVPFFEQAYPELRVVAQQGHGLGDRMWRSIRQAAEEGCEQIVLTGSDIPGLSPTIVQQAVNALERHDAVIGPAEDGGYYLIGMRAPGVNLFNDMPWSTDQVCRLTRRRAQEMNLSVASVATLRDIDNLDDLLAWQDRVRPVVD